jgi:hypothetical protein
MSKSSRRRVQIEIQQRAAFMRQGATQDRAGANLVRQVRSTALGFSWPCDASRHISLHIVIHWAAWCQSKLRYSISDRRKVSSRLIQGSEFMCELAARTPINLLMCGVLSITTMGAVQVGSIGYIFGYRSDSKYVCVYIGAADLAVAK